MATYSNTKKFIDAYGADGVISRSELNNYTGSNWEKILNQAAKGKFRLGSKAEDYVKSAQFDEQFNSPDIGTPGYQGDLDAFIDTGAVSSLYEPGRAYASYGDLTLSVPADQANNLTIRPATITETADGSYESTPLEGFGGISPVTVDTAPADGNEYTRDELLELIGGSVNNTGFFGSYSGDYEVSPITSDTQYGYSSSYQPSSDTGSQSSTALGPNTSSGDMVQGRLRTYDLNDPADIAALQTYESDFYRNLVAQGQIPGVDITDLPPLEEEEEEVYIPPTGGVDLTGGIYQPGSDSQAPVDQWIQVVQTLVDPVDHQADKVVAMLLTLRLHQNLMFLRMLTVFIAVNKVESWMQIWVGLIPLLTSQLTQTLLTWLMN